MRLIWLCSMYIIVYLLYNPSLSLSLYQIYIYICMRVSRVCQDQSTINLHITHIVGSTYQSPFSQQSCAETWFLRAGHSNFAAATRCMVGRLDRGRMESGFVDMAMVATVLFWVRPKRKWWCSYVVPFGSLWGVLVTNWSCVFVSGASPT